MKIMTLNTHSLAEPEYESKLAAFAGSLVQIKPDIIALQEVDVYKRQIFIVTTLLLSKCSPTLPVFR